MNNILTKGGKMSVVFACVLLLVASAAAQISLRKAMDTDGDGKADFSVVRPENNVWYIKHSNGGNTFQQFGSSETDYTVPGDYDGDGKGDIAVWRDTNGVWYRLNSSNNTFVATQFGAVGDEPVARDYDGDGKTDLAVVRRTSTVMIWYVLRSQTGGLLAAEFGAALTDYVAPGDYDGDLKFDFAVQRPGPTPTSQGTFYILQTTTNGLSVIPWGFSNDIVVPGDYDGDGKTDVAVAREGSTAGSPITWLVRQSSNGALKAGNFGATVSDITAQNDYDGDGKTDFAVWRDTNGVFYVLRSGDGGFSGTQWGVLNDFPVANYDSH